MQPDDRPPAGHRCAPRSRSLTVRETIRGAGSAVRARPPAATLLRAEIAMINRTRNDLGRERVDSSRRSFLLGATIANPRFWAAASSPDPRRGPHKSFRLGATIANLIFCAAASSRASGLARTYRSACAQPSRIRVSGRRCPRRAGGETSPAPRRQGRPCRVGAGHVASGPASRGGAAMGGGRRGSPSRSPEGARGTRAGRAS